MDVEDVERPLPSWRQILSYRITTKQLAVLTTCLVPFILFLLICFMFLISGDKLSIKKDSTIQYPHWKSKKSLLRACGIPVQNNPFLKINNASTYLIGSYIEHRLDEMKIRTISVVLRSENANYHCLLCCNGQLMSIPATCTIHRDHFDYIYGTADIMCNIPEKCISPSYLTITSGPPQKSAQLKDIRALIPIRNQQPQKVYPYKFTVCISTMFDYVNVLLLVQAIEMFKILGAQKVAIYKTSCNSDTQKVLDYYVKQNIVDIIPWHAAAHVNVSRGWLITVSPGDLHYFGQIAALNDCLYRYMYQSQYIILNDMDEYILPLNVPNWSELMPVLENKYGDTVGFEFETFFFPTSIMDLIPKYSPPSWKKVFGDNMLEHIYRLNKNPHERNPFKMITNPRLIFKTSVHGFLEAVDKSVRVDPEIAHLYHIRNVSVTTISKYSISRDTRLRDFANLLIPAVSGVLEIMDFY